MSSDVTVTCPACGDTHEAPGSDPDFLKRGISVCSICSARVVYGELAPRIVVEPKSVDTFAGPKDFMRLCVQDPKTKESLVDIAIDPHHAFLIAQSIITMVRP